MRKNTTRGKNVEDGEGELCEYLTKKLRFGLPLD